MKAEEIKNFVDRACEWERFSASQQKKDASYWVVVDYLDRADGATLDDLAVTESWTLDEKWPIRGNRSEEEKLAVRMVYWRNPTKRVLWLHPISEASARKWTSRRVE